MNVCAVRSADVRLSGSLSVTLQSSPLPTVVPIAISTEVQRVFAAESGVPEIVALPPAVAPVTEKSTEKPAVRVMVTVLVVLDAAPANPVLGTKFNPLRGVSRFAHFRKVMVRNRVGSFMERQEMELWLNRWINNYVISNPEGAGEETKAKYPLAWAEIKGVTHFTHWFQPLT